MDTATETQIVTRADGTIDTAYYMARGRTARSRAALGVGGGIKRWLRRALRGRPGAGLLPAEPGRTDAAAPAPTHAAAGLRRAA